MLFWQSWQSHQANDHVWGEGLWREFTYDDTDGVSVGVSDDDNDVSDGDVNDNEYVNDDDNDDDLRVGERLYPEREFNWTRDSEDTLIQILSLRW